MCLEMSPLRGNGVRVGIARKIARTGKRAKMGMAVRGPLRYIGRTSVSSYGMSLRMSRE
jgi:hypothetical protein